MPNTHSVPDDLHKYFNSWQRLESRSRDNEFDEGLEARTADPLWLLSRQWQLGEFQAEDAGSLVSVEIRSRSEDVSEFIRPVLEAIPTEQNIIPLDDASPPLEVLVEREPVNWDWRMRIRTGQQFERYLREIGDTEGAELADIDGYIGALRVGDDCGIVRPEEEELDRATRYRVRLLTGRGIDGEKLWGKIRDNALSDANEQLDQGVIDQAAEKIQTWYSNLFCQPEGDHNPCWQPKTLDYKFELKAPNGDEGRTHLASSYYRNGDLEWYTCNLEGNQVQGNVSEPNVKLATPTRVSYGGMPHPRWWAMEDYEVDFGQMDVAPTDLIKILLAEFALVYGDDWFVVPLALRVGTINHIVSVKTTDVFNNIDDIGPARANDDDPLQRWDLFSLADNSDPRRNAVSDFIYIPHSTGFREESEPVEEVRFIRDEGANMVWGIEHVVPNAWGKPVSAFDLQSEKFQNLVDEKTDSSGEAEHKELQLVYELASTVPANWIPFIPVRISETYDQILLQRAKMPLVEGEEGIGPRSRILGGKNSSDKINEEAITRAGVKVQLTKQRMRWTDGRTYTWLGRKVITGRGEGSSGLVFDKAEIKKA
jgi:hypothetical protein